MASLPAHLAAILQSGLRQDGAGDGLLGGSDALWPPRPVTRVPARRTARSLLARSPRVRSIAVLFLDASEQALRTPLSGRLLHGIEGYLRRREMQTFVTRVVEPGRLPAGLDLRHVQGVLIRANGDIDSRVLEALAPLPTVRLFEPPGVVQGDVAMEDNWQIGRLAAEYLAGRGRRSVAYLCTRPAHPSFRSRGRAFLGRAQELGAVASTLVPEGPGDEDEIVAELVTRLAHLPARPRGVFVPGSDLQVRQVYRALEAVGLKVGCDVDLISCNNDARHLAALDPTLPNIDIHAEAIGQAAAHTLLWRAENPGEPGRRVMIAAHLVLTASTSQTPWLNATQPRGGR